MTELATELQDKLNKIVGFFQGKRVIIAFSGGVDSALLAFLAFQHAKSTLLITEGSKLYSEEDTSDARAFAAQFGIPHEIILTNPFHDPQFSQNPPNRCYACKKHLYQEILTIKDARNFDFVVDGTNYDDLSDHRPGFQAVRELDVKAPYVDFKVTKNEIRQLASGFDLPVATKPSMACFASRIPYHEPITPEKLERVQAAEKFLRDNFGLKQVRVRCHGNHLARIEVLPSDMTNFLVPEKYERIVKQFKVLGFCYVTVDLEGFRSGSMNEIFQSP